MTSQQAQAASSHEWGDRPISSMNDVSAALEFVSTALTKQKLPVLPESVLKLISGSTERERFMATLGNCARLTKNADQEMQHYLIGMIRCLSSKTSELLRSLGYSEPPIEAMFFIGSTKGIEFSNALSAAANPQSPNCDIGKDRVSTCLQEAMDFIGHTGATLLADRSISNPQHAPDDNSHEAASTDRSQDDAEPASFNSTHVYGGKAALCFNAAKSQGNDHFTLVVDGAASISERVYDWKKAVKIQLGHKELPLLFGVLMGWQNRVKFDAHGKANDKAFEIERQDGKFFAKVIGKEDGKAVARAVPIGPADAYPIMMVTLSQIVKEAPKELQGNPSLIVQMMREAQNIRIVAGVVAK